MREGREGGRGGLQWGVAWDVPWGVASLGAARGLGRGLADVERVERPSLALAESLASREPRHVYTKHEGSGREGVEDKSARSK